MDKMIETLKHELARRYEFQKKEMAGSEEKSNKNQKNDKKLRKELTENFDQLKKAIETWKKEVF
jgi:hypothetical protein